VAEEPRKDIDQMTVAELRTRASELEITGRSSMKKEELRQVVADAEEQLGLAGGGSSERSDRAADGEKPASDIPAPSIGPHTEISKEPPEKRLARHEQSDIDAMGLDKRRGVVGQKVGASFAKQATVYGVFLVIVVALVIGGKLAADELDKGPAVNADEAAWSQETAKQRPPRDPDFPASITP
jgi:hypothetical protein